jgi:hypothetical protein
MEEGILWGINYLHFIHICPKAMVEACWSKRHKMSRLQNIAIFILLVLAY